LKIQAGAQLETAAPACQSMAGPLSSTGVSRTTAITRIAGDTTCAIGNGAPRFQFTEFSGLEMMVVKRRREAEMDDRTVRAALQRHWEASDANDFNVEHEIYRDDAVLHYPQSGERIRGRHNIQESRFVQPNKKRFKVQRIVGSGDLWVTEFVLSYDGVPSYSVSIMEFRDGLVANETQYFADRFDPAPSRANLVERG
jgi:hypothetical protein